MAWLRLYRGRAGPHQVVDWKAVSGPIFGPFSHFQRNHHGDIQFDEQGTCVLRIVDGFVYYGGMYYAEWDVFDEPPAEWEREFIVSYAADLARLPVAARSVASGNSGKSTTLQTLRKGNGRHGRSKNSTGSRDSHGTHSCGDLGK